LGTRLKKSLIEGPGIGFLFDFINKKEVVWILSVNEAQLYEKSNIAENKKCDIN
jgi:hypothetical protein